MNGIREAHGGFELEAAHLICRALGSYVPERATRLWIAEDGPHLVYLIQTERPGQLICASLFRVAGEDKPRLAQVLVWLQTLATCFRTTSMSYSYEELGEVLAGTPLPTLRDRGLHDYMKTDPSEALRQLTNDGYRTYFRHI